MSLYKSDNGLDAAPGRRLILLAEDHPLNQKVAVLLLERMGFDVDVVGDGAKAVDAVIRRPYHAVLMDCHMPEVDGFEATRRIRLHELKTGQHVAIIAVTALAMAGDRERCLAAGMDDYLTKPINGDLLHKKLVYWMNPGATLNVRHANNVIQIFDEAFALNGEHSSEDPVDISRLFDSYGAEASNLLVLFENSSERIIERLTEAVTQNDCTQIATLSHELKGASWAVGADEMARLSVFIEQAAAQQNQRLIHRTFVRLKHHFAEVKRFIKTKVLSDAQSNSESLTRV